MRKILLVAAASALGPIAFGLGAGSALAQVPSQTTCYRTADYDSSRTWSFQAVNPTVKTPAASPSPDACVNVSENTSPSPTDALAVAGNITLSAIGNLS